VFVAGSRSSRPEPIKNHTQIRAELSHKRPLNRRGWSRVRDAFDAKDPEPRLRIRDYLSATPFFGANIDSLKPGTAAAINR